MYLELDLCVRYIKYETFIVRFNEYTLFSFNNRISTVVINHEYVSKLVWKALCKHFSFQSSLLNHRLTIEIRIFHLEQTLTNFLRWIFNAIKRSGKFQTFLLCSKFSPYKKKILLTFGNPKVSKMENLHQIITSNNNSTIPITLHCCQNCNEFPRTRIDHFNVRIKSRDSSVFYLYTLSYAKDNFNFNPRVAYNSFFRADVRFSRIRPIHRASREERKVSKPIRKEQRVIKRHAHTLSALRVTVFIALPPTPLPTSLWTVVLSRVSARFHRVSSQLSARDPKIIFPIFAFEQREYFSRKKNTIPAH